MRGYLGCVVLTVVLALGGASRGGADEDAVEKKAMKVLDDFMTAFNAKDRKKQAATFNFPHVRIAGDKVTLYQKPEDFEKDRELEKYLDKVAWHHSKWDSRKVIQRSPKK